MSDRPVVRLSAENYGRGRALLGRAFRDYSLMAYVAHDRWRARSVTSLYGGILADCYRYGEVYATADLAGVACWLTPGCAAPGLARQITAGMLAIPFRFGWRGLRCLVAYDRVARRLHHDYARAPHWFLAAIGVEPGLQGQGIGSALLRPVLARADSQGLDCWLDTHQEQNVRLYERHGFKVAECVELEGHPVPVYGMLRRAGGTPAAPMIGG